MWNDSIFDIIDNKDYEKMKMKFRINSIWTKILLIAFVYLLSICDSLANDGVVVAWNGNVRAWKNNKIQMVKEVVYVKLFDDKCKVRCKFWFYNSGNTDTVKVGFPNESYNDGSPGSISLENFRTLVNNKEQEVQSYFDSIQTDTIYDDNGKISSIDTTDFDEWYVKDVIFKGKDTTYIEDSYETDWTGSSGGYFRDRTFRYIIGTGSTWNGTILDGTIIFDMSDYETNVLQNSFYGDFRSCNITETDNLTVLKFHNKIPFLNSQYIIEFIDLNNVWFSDYDGSQDEEELASFKTYMKKRDLSQDEIVLMKNEILAHNGYIFKDTTIQKYYSGMKWYKPDKKFNLKKFNHPFYQLLKKNCKVPTKRESESYIKVQMKNEELKDLIKECIYIDQMYMIDK